jgi:precorrin-2 dehydrogenase
LRREFGILEFGAEGQAVRREDSSPKGATMSELFPIFLKLRGRPALVVGGGTMAAVRVRQLVKAGARVTVIAPEIGPEIEAAARGDVVTLIRREFKAGDLSGDLFLVVGATDDPEVQETLAREAERLGLLFNIVDKPQYCNYYTPAVVERGGLCIAIGSEGQSPVLAGRLRQILDESLPDDAGDWTALLGELRERLKTIFPADMARRRELINEFIAKVTHL